MTSIAAARRFFTILTFSLALGAQAQQTGFGHIIQLQTGSLGGLPVTGAISTKIAADDTMAVTLDVSFVNSSETGPIQIKLPRPACKITNGGYALDPQDSGVKVNESVLLSAYLADRKVLLHLNGCVFGKPRIVSVVLSASNN